MALIALRSVRSPPTGTIGSGGRSALIEPGVARTSTNASADVRKKRTCPLARLAEVLITGDPFRRRVGVSLSTKLTLRSRLVKSGDHPDTSRLQCPAPRGRSSVG